MEARKEKYDNLYCHVSKNTSLSFNTNIETYITYYKAHVENSL